MKNFSRLVIGLVLLSGIVFSSGCATRSSHEKNEGVFSAGGFIWPAPQSQILVVNGTQFLVKIKEGPYVEVPCLGPTESYAFNYNVFDVGGKDVSLTAIIYRKIGVKTFVSTNNISATNIVVATNTLAMFETLGMVTKTFHLNNSRGRAETRTWIIENVGNRDSFVGRSSR